MEQKSIKFGPLQKKFRRSNIMLAARNHLIKYNSTLRCVCKWGEVPTYSWVLWFLATLENASAALISLFDFMLNGIRVECCFDCCLLNGDNSLTKAVQRRGLRGREGASQGPKIEWGLQKIFSSVLLRGSSLKNEVLSWGSSDRHPQFQTHSHLFSSFSPSDR